MIRLALALILFVGCATKEKQDREYREQHICSSQGSKDSGCAVIAGALLFLNVAGSANSTTSPKKRATPAIFGRCEMVVIDGSGTKPIPKPCEQVLFKVRQNGADVRDAWVDGFDFEIAYLKPGSYDLEAISEKYDTRAKLAGVKTGSTVKIELRLSKK